MLTQTLQARMFQDMFVLGVPLLEKILQPILVVGGDPEMLIDHSVLREDAMRRELARMDQLSA